MDKERQGVNQVIGSAAIGLLQLVIASTVYAAFAQPVGSALGRTLYFVQGIFALVAAASLILIPWVATHGTNDYSTQRMDRARALYVLGASFTFITFIVILVRAFIGR
jgi:hypothetical protein